MVIKDRTHLGIVVDTLATRSVDKTVRLQDSGTSTFRALLASLVDESSSGAGRSADLDLVLGTLGGAVRIKAAALADREEEVVVFTVQSDEGSFLGMLALGLECERDLAGPAYDLGRWVLHVNGEEIGPEGAVGHDELGAVPVQRTVDGIIVVAWF